MAIGLAVTDFFDASVAELAVCSWIALGVLPMEGALVVLHSIGRFAGFALIADLPLVFWVSQGFVYLV